MNRQYVFIALGVVMVIFAIFAAVELKSQMDRSARMHELDNSLSTSNFILGSVFSQGIHRT